MVVTAVADTRASLNALMATASLLLGYVKGCSPILHLVIDAGFGGLTVVRDRHLENGDDLAVELIGFLQRVLAHDFSRHAGDARIALHRRVGAIQLCGVSLSGAIGHGDLVSADLVCPQGRMAFS